MKIKKSWFTLIELVVVIVILAILSTIGLLAFRGYSADARNSKRSQDIDNLKNRFTTQITNGANSLWFVATVTDNQVTAATLGLQWLATKAVLAPTASYNYDAGTINYDSLWINTSDFLDPDSSSALSIKYVAWVTSLLWGKYQVAASMEDSTVTWGRKALVSGTWFARPVAISANAAAAGTTTFTIVSPKDAYKFAVGDTINYSGASTNTTTITAISADWLTISLTAAPTTTATGIALALAENAALIDNGKGATWNVTNNWTVLPY